MLGYWNEAGGIPELRAGSHTVTIHVTLVDAATDNYMISVFLDGAPVLYQELANSGVFGTTTNPDPGMALLAFTAGTAAHPDMHLVQNVAISAQQ